MYLNNTELLFVELKQILCFIIHLFSDSQWKICDLLHFCWCFMFSEGRPLPEGTRGCGDSCWPGTWPHSVCGNYVQRAELLLCWLHLLLWPANLLPVIWPSLSRKHFSESWRHLLCQHCNFYYFLFREFRFTSEVPIWLDYHGKHVVIEQVRGFIGHLVGAAASVRKKQSKLPARSLPLSFFVSQGTFAGILIGLAQLNCSELKLKRLCCRHG